MVKGDTIFIILLVIILFVFAYLYVLPILSGIPKSECIIAQWAALRSLEEAIEHAKKTGSVYPEYKFEVMYCTECVWYDSQNSEFKIKIVKQNDPIPFKVYGNYMNISDGCSYQIIPPPLGQKIEDCDIHDATGKVVGDCANMKKDNTYIFEITPDYAKCTNCLYNDYVVDCEKYEGSCSNRFDWRKTDGLQCNVYPSGAFDPLIEKNWLGEYIGPSSRAKWGEWGDPGLCLKIPKTPCTSYTECALYPTFGIGSKAHYACYTIGSDAKTRCCSPLLSERELGISAYDNSATICTNELDCEFYCEDTSCGYVYDDPTDISNQFQKSQACCKPTGERCIGGAGIGGTWECCAYENMIDISSADFLPSRCLDTNNEVCNSGDECYCCIGAGYNCIPGERDRCCGEAVCKDLGGPIKCCLDPGRSCQRDWQCCSGTCSSGACT